MSDALPPAAERADGRGAREDFRPTDRVKTRAEFRQIQDRGRKIHSRCFVFAVLRRIESGEGVQSTLGTRLGITVTRKVANAVGRNRVKRVMREVFRRNRELFPSGCDIVVIAKSSAPSLGYAEALDEVRRASAPLFAASRAAPAPARGSGRARR